ncbi:hypothetical protein FZD47_21020 [Bacillus infantis]|uniref:Uncharacterized protein n=1 Tax=Bacillus infantis TaxID=324767 RepID=A0A5D4SFB8_9BACI|nr:hypothetical protein [Bacillus infantis]TYS60692.1 hypothetical protein FZD47_21020 [Bacillus infantis]
MRVLLAVGESNLSKILRSHLVKANFDVLEDEVLHRNYMNEIIDNEKPNMIIVHDLYLPSEQESQPEREKEMLKFIEHWRMTYNSDLRVVYLCERERDEPFLGDLVARNVLDIFYTRNISTREFIEQLSKPPHFTNVQMLGVGKYQIEIIEDEEPTHFEGQDDNPPSHKEENAPEPQLEHKQRSRLPDIALPRIPKIKKADGQKKEKKERQVEQYPTDIPGFDEELIDIIPVQKEFILREKIVGTVVVGVGSVAPHVGSTHTAISIASYLKKQGHFVALVEGNHSEDFERIHAMYEGEKRHLWQMDVFDVNEIDHYKYRDFMSLGDIFTDYEFVVLDLGHFESTPYLAEFYRAHVKCVVSPGIEWKQHWIETFTKVNPEYKEFTYIVPFGSVEAVKDIEALAGTSRVFSFPVQPNPYEGDATTEQVITQIVDGYLKKADQKVVTRTAVITACIASAAITSLVIGAFLWL